MWPCAEKITKSYYATNICKLDPLSNKNGTENSYIFLFLSKDNKLNLMKAITLGMSESSIIGSLVAQTKFSKTNKQYTSE